MFRENKIKIGLSNTLKLMKDDNHHFITASGNVTDMQYTRFQDTHNRHGTARPGGKIWMPILGLNPDDMLDFAIILYTIDIINY